MFHQFETSIILNILHELFLGFLLSFFGTSITAHLKNGGLGSAYGERVSVNAGEMKSVWL